MDDARTISLLQDLVRIDSVNPSLVPGGRGEAAIAARIAAELGARGLEVRLEEVAPGRPNVIGVVDGRRSGRTLLLCGHIDTVGYEGMEEPLSGRCEDGKVFGRGSVDMKGGVTVMLAAAARLAAEGLEAGRLIVAGVADEEHASRGAEALVRSVRADAAVVLEPTDLEVVVAHKGFGWAEVETAGVAAHGSRPDLGRDAILRMGHVLVALETLDRELRARPPHALLGTASLHASLVSGGRELSTYPERCTLKLERRTLPDERPEVVLEEVEAILARLREGAIPASARFLFGRPGYETPGDHPLLGLLEDELKRSGRPARRAAAHFWTDAAILGGAGIPTVLFGPGGEGLHGLREYVRIDEVILGRDVLAAAARSYCAGDAA